MEDYPNTFNSNTAFGKLVIEASHLHEVFCIHCHKRDELPNYQYAHRHDVFYQYQPATKFGVAVYREGLCIRFLPDHAGILAHLAARKAAYNTPYTPSKSPQLVQNISLNYQHELNRLIGMAGPKAEVRRLAALGVMRQRRDAAGLPRVPTSLHIVFTGNPGTGKTTFARIIAKVYAAHGLTKTDKLVELDRTGLVGAHIGQSEQITSARIEEARGGSLFVDEAYALAGTGNDYGPLVIAAFVKKMEDMRDELAVMAAGYTKPMQTFINTNQGLRSRFTRWIHFPDYSPEELYQIFMGLVVKYKYCIHIVETLRSIINRHWQLRDENFGNARDMRTFWERVHDVQSFRIVTKGGDPQMIWCEDLKEGAKLAKLNGA